MLRYDLSRTLWFLLIFAACGGGGSGRDGYISLVLVTAASEAECPRGGSLVATGLDKNRNDTLDADEVTESFAVCQGTLGVTGAYGEHGLMLSEPVLPNELCPFGGVRMAIGIDENQNGVLDADEYDPSESQVFCTTEAPGLTGLVFLAPLELPNSLSLYRVNADGLGLTKLMATPDASGTLFSPLSVSPDKKWVAFTAIESEGEPPGLYVASLRSSRRPVRVSGPVGAGHSGVIPEAFWWSPDGSRLAFVADRVGDTGYELYVVLPDGSGRIRVDNQASSHDMLYFSGVAWSADGTYLAYRSNSRYYNSSYYQELYVSRADGTSAWKIDPSANTTSYPNAFAWSPDRGPEPRIAFWITYGGSSTLYVTTALVQPDASDNYVRVSDDDLDDDFSSQLPQWEPTTGAYLASLGRATADAYASLELYPAGGGAPIPLDITSDVNAFAWSPTGAWLAARVYDSAEGTYRLWTARAGESAASVVSGEDLPAGVGIDEIAWSPDGSRLAYIAPGENLDTWSLFTVAPGGGETTTISNTIKYAASYYLPLTAGSFAWSPNGSQLAYLSGPQGEDRVDELYVASPTDSGGGVSVSDPVGEGDMILSFRWSPDGSSLAYVAERSGVSTIFLTSNAAAASDLPLVPDTQAGNMFWSELGFDFF